MKSLVETKVVFDKEYFNELRKEKNMKINKLSLLTGICIDRISKYKNGHSTPSAYSLYKIALVLDTTMEDLLKEV